MSTTVLYSPFTSIFENGAAGTALVGKPGSGKTFSLLNIMANAIMMEQRIFCIDPKDDAGVLTSVYPDKLQYIDINNITPGALNPFTVIQHVDTNTIVSVISIICGGFSSEESVAVTPIINDFVQRNRIGARSSFADVADYLYANDNHYAQAIGTKLKIHKDSKYGPLLFGHAGLNINLGGQKSKIISLHGMDLPKSNGVVTEVQKFNSAIVYIICRMLKDVLTAGNYPTLFVLDEAHIAFQNPSFAAIVDEFLVLGRSLNVATVLASQAVSHYPDQIAQLIATKFCFRSSTQDAEEFMKKFYNQDGDDTADIRSIVHAIGDFNPGDCFMIDSRNRTGIFHFTSNLGDITSNPLMKKKKGD